jgi:(p)ppGpp synthase/HD superfamily hydrolase
VKSKTRPSKRVFEAIEFAVRSHGGVRQCRKGTSIPYIVHPLGVARILIEVGAPESVVIAGLLHDTVEDTPVTVKQIERRFGPKVARLVSGASEPDKSDSWENRKRHTVEYLKSAPLDAVLVSAADKLDNIRSIREDIDRHGEAVWSRFNRPKQDQRWYFKSLNEVFGERLRGHPAGAALAKEFDAEVRRVFGGRRARVPAGRA